MKFKAARIVSAVGIDKRFPIMYPSEDRTFLGTTTIPLWARVYFGFLHREGARRGEGVAMQRRDLDLKHQTVDLDANKTDHPRFWKLSPGVAEALEAWLSLRGDVKPEARVFVDEGDGVLNVDHMTDHLRAWMQKAGLDRGDLYSVGPNKGRVGTHCYGDAKPRARRERGHGPPAHGSQVRPAPEVPPGCEGVRGARSRRSSAARALHPRALADPGHRGVAPEALPRHREHSAFERRAARQGWP
jgi:hypothetical protein